MPDGGERQRGADGGGIGRGGRPLKVLMVAEDDFPWSETGGGPLRSRQVVGALAELGSLDLFAAVHVDRLPTMPPGAPVRRAEVVGRTYALSRPRRLLRQLRGFTGDRPRVLDAEDLRGPTAAFRRFMRGERYDLVWFNSPSTFVHFGPLVDAPAVVDMDDLEDHKLVHALRAEGSPAGAGGWLRRRLDLLDVARWRLLELDIASRVGAVAVASELDRLRLGAPNAVVVPNDYELTFALEPSPAADCVTFVGSMGYPPNADAARFLVAEIVPELRRIRPGTKVRIVGRGGDPAMASDDVAVIGFVEDLGVELSRAGVVLVPLRSGGGTRRKILEAFSLGIPVVSTAVGAEGLDVVPGTHLLLAETAEELAAATARVLGEPDLRASLAAAGRKLYEERYTPEVVRSRLHEVVAVALAAAGPPGG